MSTRPLEPDNAGVAPGGREAERERLVGLVEGGIRAEATGRLALLAERFGLDDLETDMVGLLWVTAAEPELRAAVLRQWGSSAHLTPLLAAMLCGHDRRPRLPSGSPLLLWQIVGEHDLLDGGAALTLDPQLLAWLDGHHELDRLLVGWASLLEMAGELESWPIDAIALRLHEGLREGRRWRIRIVSADLLAARWFAAGLGRRIGLPVLEVAPGAGALPGSAVRLHRQAFLDHCIPFFSVADAALDDPPSLAPYPIRIVHGPAGPPVTPASAAELVVELAPPAAEERERLWRRLWPESATWKEGSLADLALCHECGISDIAAIAATCPEDAAAAASALRARVRSEAPPFVRRIETVFGWDDLVLAERTRGRLEEIAFEARERVRLWAEPEAARLFPYGRGLIALFAGPPGTGKTMAAQVIAADLGLDLLAVDLPSVVSKWVGETAQNLQQMLISPAARRSVLFFDEADSFFAKRIEDLRDAQDRYVNQDSSHLMTALEAYPGIVILATNLKGNIDGAFLRRIRHVVDFARADAAAREAIWRKAVEALFPADQAAALLPELGRVARIEAGGAVIKNAALSAVFASRRTGDAPTIRLLGEMAARELGKEGAGISARDLDALLGPGR